MMRSLRLRFFFIMWPLVVVAVGGVALSFARWTRVDLEQMITGFTPLAEDQLDALVKGVATLIDSAAVSADGSPARTKLNAELAQQVGAVGLVGDAAIVSPQGEMIATTDAALRLSMPPLHAADVAEFDRTRSQGGVAVTELLQISGKEVVSTGGSLLGGLYFFPALDDATDEAPMTAIRANARRTLWIAVVLSSAAAAAAAILLAGPMVRQVTRLAEGASAVEGGDLETRVPEGAEDELGKLERSFNAMAEALQKAERLKRNVVSDVAHELRTPLTNLIGQLEAIQDGLRQPDAATIQSLWKEAGLIAGLVDELQDLALAESGQLIFEVVRLDATAEATDALDACATLAVGVTLQGPSTDEAISVMADRRRLRQVLTNLIRNAMTHTSAGDAITVDVQPKGDSVAFIVRDTGTGIPTEHLGLIWERFHRVDPSRDRSSGGMGLGLAVVRQLVIAMGGSVEVESQQGFGSQFTVTLPRGA